MKRCSIVRYRIMVQSSHSASGEAEGREQRVEGRGQRGEGRGERQADLLSSSSAYFQTLLRKR